ncbi:bifunctional proline dehydrogenase/L-glutamate gamma-semialdehyde dehydrogenase PutA [Marinobacterium sp. D7]|uniref:bifunctional proline dehydrogenase/L-glutamate gamma-semialdehyde dehydrogenase PutA n=1 Tax=Marinobacterium ramblicola TaxID=2849041 RepID=UPI001C2CEF16|nr:bifunctional proline dehydrogenase/L-glutamate gamma-semialdehyde dehydrogenase PutA [Marinobacterium ramblicola]MBV1787418.1 bifunctional proline dehydrogenase/L-glutamate gamma-semialdehyde dehydrogenase PutA [Marinobacterium ramblicola]
MFKAIDVLDPGFIRQPLTQIWQLISPLYAADEDRVLRELMALAEPSSDELASAESRATDLIEQVRADDGAIHMIDALLLEYSLDTREGILLMCLAEALMRIPDADTADALIRDKLSIADWKRHLSQSESLLVNASTWGLLLTGKVVSLDEREDGTPSGVINRLVNRLSEPVIRKVMQQAMKIMGHQFVLGRDMPEAAKRSREYREQGYTYSFDMLGEAALTEADAQKYYADYTRAIDYVGAMPDVGSAPKPSVSIKLSALHPRYEVLQEARVMSELAERVLLLIRRARPLNVALTIDAEEADRLELSLRLFEKLYRSEESHGWNGLGLVVQAYSKRALPVLAWLAALAHEVGDRIPVRLVKGAYWDSEIKLCQQRGLSGYPVFTRKEATDVSYLACARFLLSEQLRGLIWPQFASHNAHTVASIMTLAGHADFEFQRLHGMGDALYDQVLKQAGVAVRIYAPVGNHKDLLPYLVRRLLENGANSSFVHRLVDQRCPVADLVQHPWQLLHSRDTLHNPNIPLPNAIYGAERKASSGPNILIESEWAPFAAKVDACLNQCWQADPIIDGRVVPGSALHSDVRSPADRDNLVGQVTFAGPEQVIAAIDAAARFLPSWQQTPVNERAGALRKLADLLEQHLEEFVALCHQEAGKTIQDSIDEVREAVDFCRYYPARAEELFSEHLDLHRLDGGLTKWQRQGRGIFVCISPWNFPLAIFLGQVGAALVAGNCVIAKPAEQTSLIAARAIELLLEAGVPGGAIQFLPGDGATVGAALTADPRIAGVAFTGSTETAQRINRALSLRDGADAAEPATLIAETGGQNAMIVDSTALPEQVVKDALLSGFASAGQRCSALRVLCLQQDIADRIIELLEGAMAELRMGDPALLSTDIGPVIDESAQSGLRAHIERMREYASLLAQTPLPNNAKRGTFVPPTLIEVDRIDQIGREQFGPIIHVLRYEARHLDRLIDQINAAGYGLTLGIHSRNERTAAHIEARARVGNTYINRNQIGAVVGVQPFGGQGLSGTGPKAGGPHYLPRFTRLIPANEQ